MGCTVSKLDDLPAVALCRERCNFLDEAIRYRYSFADSHVAYIHSLKGFAVSFDRFFDLHLQDPENFTPVVVLPLPPQRKGDPDPDPVHNPPPPPHNTTTNGSIPVIHHSHSNSGSHLHFHSDSDDEDHDEQEDDDDDDSDEFGSHHHFHDHETLGSMPMPMPMMHNGGGNGYMNMNQGSMPMPMNNGGGNGYMTMNHQGSMPMNNGGGYMTMNYMQNRSTPSVLYQQRPMSPETVHFGEASSSSSNAYNPYSSYPSNSYDQSNAYYNHPPPPVYSNYGGFYGSAPQYGSSSPPPYMAAQVASSSKPPPPPPSPPRASAWDFLNPFEIYERYYPPQTPSRDSREVREEEGIPDLEDEDYQQEVVKEVQGNHKFQNFSDGGGGGNVGNGGNFSKDEGGGGEREKGGGEAGIHQAKNNVAAPPPVENDDGGVKYEVHVVDKKVVANEEQSEEKNNNVGAFKSRGGGSRDVSEVVREIKDQFEKASDAGIEVSKMLEAGKLPYNKRHSVYQVSSKMLHSITPSLSVVSSQPSASGAVYLGVDEDVGISLRNLSSTLQKLYIWEKKLYEEVKVEEKMRLIHDRKCRRLKRLDEKGAEAHKVDSTRTLVRALSTKIGMAIQVVEKISITISKLRDEELWPQINELIHGLVRMWKVMLESHRNQFQAMSEAKNLDALAFNRKLNDTNLEATVQLQLELLNWIVRFSSWVVAQKAFVSALNSWLLKCLLNEPEETADGIAPFSPGRMGAPPVFVICNQWSQAMERISEKEVIDTMRVFAMSVHHLCKQNNMELRQRMTANRDMERRVKALEREEQKMQKALQVADKQMVMVSGQNYGLSVPDQIVQPSDTSNTSLQSGLRQIFEAMERFTGNSMQAYEELRVRSEEQRLGPENARVP